MADLITKIGADSSQFRNEVSSLGGVVKEKFSQMKKDSEGGINESIDQIKGNIRNLKDLIIGGGIITAVVKFFQAGTEEAEKMAKAGNTVAQSFLDIKAAGSGGVDMIGKASVATFGSLGLAVGVFKTGLENIGALLTGNLASLEATRDALKSGAKAANEQEAAQAEMKKHAAEWQKLNAEALAATEKRTELELKALSTADQKNVLQQKLMEAQRAEAESAEHSLTRRTAQVEQIKISNQLLEVGKAIQDEVDKATATRRTEVEAIHKAQLAALEPVKREAVLRQEIKDVTALINSGLLSAKDTDAQRVVLATRQKELIETTTKEHAKQNEIKEAGALSTEDQIKQERLLAKGAGARTGEERTALEILKLQSKEKINQAEIAELLKKKTTDGLTPAEQANLVSLIQQTDKLGEQIAEKTALIEKTKEQAAAEGRIIPVIDTQIKKAIELNKIKRMGTGYDAQSTEALKGVRDRVASNLADAQFADRQSIPTVGATTESFSTSAFTSELFNIEKELKKRAEVSAFAKQYGEQATVRQFGDDLANRALTDLRDVSTRTANALEQINTRLEASGLFPRS